MFWGEIPSMKPNSSNDLQEPEQSATKALKRTIRRPRKNAPATDQLRGWAKSAIKSRNKS
jgi:hypothetical protein